jgi:hypothetical protein
MLQGQTEESVIEAAFLLTSYTFLLSHFLPSSIPQQRHSLLKIRDIRVAILLVAIHVGSILVNREAAHLVLARIARNSASIRTSEGVVLDLALAEQALRHAFRLRPANVHDMLARFTTFWKTLEIRLFLFLDMRFRHAQLGVPFLLFARAACGFLRALVLDFEFRGALAFCGCFDARGFLLLFLHACLGFAFLFFAALLGGFAGAALGFVGFELQVFSVLGFCWVLEAAESLALFSDRSRGAA